MAILKQIKVCGPKRCLTLLAEVDTGAFGTAISEKAFSKLGIKTQDSLIAGTVSGPLLLRSGPAKVCMSGCKCIKMPVYTGRMRQDETFDALLGMDYLKEAGVIIDAANDIASCSWRKNRKRRSRSK